MAARKPQSTATGEIEILPFETPADWETWLATHHASSPGIWIRFAKKASGQASINYAQALEVALTYGWIDGQSKGEGDATWRQRFLPRAKKSIWSKINREKALKLIENGAMKPAGLQEVERAKADGRWEAAYDAPSAATVPDDLRAAFDENPAANRFFATLDAQNRYAILHRIQTAKRPETRANRIRTFVEMLSKGEKLHP